MPLVPLPLVPYALINKLPFTSNVVSGIAVPIPTLPFAKILNLSALFAAKINGVFS